MTIAIGRRALPALGLAAAGAAQAQAQWNPTRPLTIVVPFPPGGSTDVTARALAERMVPLLGQNIVIDNRPGGQTVIGAEAVARAAPDGHTMLMSSGTTLTINPLIGRNLPYRPEDFAPVLHVATLPFCIAVKPGIPDTLEGFVAHVRANPGRVTWGHNGRGSFNHIAGALIADRLGLDWQDVGYRGDAHQMTDLLAGTLDSVLVGGATGLALARTGRAKIIGWTGETRLPNLPDQPVFNEIWPGLVAITWFGLLVPARTPPAAVARLNAAAGAALAEAAVRDRLLNEGIQAAGGTPADFQAFLTREAERWRPLLRRLDIQL
ncbi:tripartite tricarboxylate transporter substrate binding protein [Roseomonas alkaliterrae]|uniref:Tripartite-type tricarboxylate transporter receptor subunit TctC n=1 Tax=Neoroseomonas alkaliterrae TaxID=1452450 RepID=A0A840XU55_9PROT|nr:tripartite tricarboxylate transporter substrate binding protein [Neoroseomonas alkaliterrae]MBB5691416.1 tripartite-type tricarboxylate transporter receptor subunit TctC [Neoroseomonas alkaliterrae]MBR0675552.1 tripartite tricarboxylate transporter substrate binding protein [Neoroseomonas alkaliterrae]